MAEMNKKDRQAFETFLAAYKYNWDLNSHYRTEYDEDLEYYLGYRDETKYPLRFSMSFNKLLPRIFTILSRFMEQLYRQGTHDLVGVRARKAADVQRCPRIQGLLNHQMEILNECDAAGGSYLFNFHWMFNALTFGKGICKLYWKKEERIAPRRLHLQIPQFDQLGRLVGIQPVSKVIEEPQVIYDGPYAEVIHNKLFVPNPLYKSIQQMPHCFLVYKRSVDYLKRMQDQGIYKNVNKLGWHKGRGTVPGMSPAGEDSAEKFAKSIEIEGVMQTARFENDRVAPEVDVIEGYGKYIFPEDEGSYEVETGIKIKGKESEAIVHIGNYKTILSIQKNTYGTRPLFDISAYWHPEHYWDIGIIRLGKEVQEQYNNLANTRFQNALQMVNQMLKVREDADIDPQALIWKPFGIVPVETMDDVQPLVTPDVSGTGIFRETEEFFDSCLEEMTGMYRYGMGATPSRQEHVGTMYSLQAMGEARTKLLLMTMDYQGFQPFLRHMMRLNCFHLDDQFEARINTPQGTAFTPLFPGDYHVDYDFTARYTAVEPALAKEFRAQQFLQLANIWQQDPYVNQYQWKKAILELMDIQDVDKYLLTPEQVQAQQQAAQKQMMQTQLLGAALQDQMAAKQSERELQRDVVKGLLT